MASTRERNGRYTGLYRDAQRRQRSAGSFGDEKAALKAAEYAEAVANPPKPVEVYPAQKRGRITGSPRTPRKWLENQVLEETSRETYRRTADRIVRHLGGMAREEVTPDDVRKMIRALKKSGLRDATISATLDLARGAPRQRGVRRRPVPDQRPAGNDGGHAEAGEVRRGRDPPALPAPCQDGFRDGLPVG